MDPSAEHEILIQLAGRCPDGLGAALLAATDDDGRIDDLAALRAVLDHADDLTLRCLGAASKRIAPAADAAGDEMPCARLLHLAMTESLATNTAPHILGIHILLALLTWPGSAAGRHLLQRGLRYRGLRSLARRAVADY